MNMVSTPNTKDITSSGTLAVSAVAGGLASNGLISIIPAGTTKVKRIVLAILSIVAAATLKGKGTLDKIAKGGFLGMAVSQGIELGMEFLSKNTPDETETDVAGQAGSFIKGVTSRGMAGSLSNSMQNIIRARGASSQAQTMQREQANSGMSVKQLLSA